MQAFFDQCEKFLFISDQFEKFLFYSNKKINSYRWGQRRQIFWSDIAISHVWDHAIENMIFILLLLLRYCGNCCNLMRLRINLNSWIQTQNRWRGFQIHGGIWCARTGIRTTDFSRDRGRIGLVFLLENGHFSLTALWNSKNWTLKITFFYKYFLNTSHWTCKMYGVSLWLA